MKCAEFVADYVTTAGAMGTKKWERINGERIRGLRNTPPGSRGKACDKVCGFQRQRELTTRGQVNSAYSAYSAWDKNDNEDEDEDDNENENED